MKTLSKLQVLALFSAAVATAALTAYGADAAANWSDHCAKCHGAEGKGDTKMGHKLNISDFTDAAVQAKFTDEQAAKAIKTGVTDENGKMRMKAIEVMIAADAPKLFEYGQVLADDPVPWVRFEGLRAMAWNRNPKSIPYLVKALEDKAELAPRSTIADNVRMWLQYGPEADVKPWPEGQAALKAAGIKD